MDSGTLFVICFTVSVILSLCGFLLSLMVALLILREEKRQFKLTEQEVFQVKAFFVQFKVQNLNILVDGQGAKSNAFDETDARARLRLRDAVATKGKHYRWSCKSEGSSENGDCESEDRREEFDSETSERTDCRRHLVTVLLQITD